VIPDPEPLRRHSFPHARDRAFEAHTRIKRDDWGLTWNKAIETGGWMVGDEIRIDPRYGSRRGVAPWQGLCGGEPRLS
jgi:hypothetical protein